MKGGRQAKREKESYIGNIDKVGPSWILELK